MVVGENLGVLVGAIALGAIHGIEPGHGWPVAASYALDQSNKWVYGLAASLIIGVGHLVSSLAMVAAFFYAKSYFDLTQIDQPIVLIDGVTIGGPVSLVAGVLLVALGIWEYRHGHTHSHGDGGDGHPHDHGDGGHDHTRGHGGEGYEHHENESVSGHDYSRTHDNSPSNPHDKHLHSHDSESDSTGLVGRIRGWLPLGGGPAHSPDHVSEPADRGLLGIAWFAFVLGFAHEEEFEIIALCAGSVYCLELMLAYASTVILGIVGLTMLLIAGYEHSEERVERYTPYLPAFSAAVLCLMGVGFVLGVF